MLPDLLGAHGRRDYLIAILNPAEQLYSGGTPLTFAPMSVRDGKLDLGVPQDTATHGAAFQPRYWPKVPGNPFHRGRLRIGTSTFAPDWSVSGEEALRAWRSLRGKQMDGLIAIDVMALRDLVAITGPLEVPFYGEVTADNFVQTLIGSYDSIPDYRVRHQINQALVPIFRDRLFRTGQFVEKLQALAAAADGRHFAVHLREPAAQAAFSELGLTGELSDTDHDYLGVFTQNAVPSKTDYWQSRTLTSDVRPRRRRQCARHRRPPRSTTTARPIPSRAAIRARATRPGSRPSRSPSSCRAGRPTSWPGSTRTSSSRTSATSTAGRSCVVRSPSGRRPPTSSPLPTTYAARRASTATTSIYRLDVDPQGLVRPAAINVTVHLPEGFEATDLPEGWVEIDDRDHRLGRLCPDLPTVLRGHSRP